MCFQFSWNAAKTNSLPLSAFTLATLVANGNEQKGGQQKVISPHGQGTVSIDTACPAKKLPALTVYAHLLTRMAKPECRRSLAIRLILWQVQSRKSSYTVDTFDYR